MSDHAAHPLAAALRTAERLYDRVAIERAIARMAGQLRNDYAGSRPVFLTVMKGGMFFGTQLAMELGIDAEFDYLHATRYRGATTGGDQLAWLAEPRSSVRGQRVLLVDDILDEGHTLVAVRDWCRRNGAADVRIAVLAWKRHGRGVEGMVPDYHGVEVPDRYVFGYGMDYHEQGRNLPAIYAL
jgi:hypoxanthine phosphoribosyltransferase